MKRPGNTLLLVLVFVVTISALAIGGLSLTQTAVRGSRARIYSQQAVRVGESGIEKAVWCLNNPGNTTECNRPGGPGTEYSGESGTSLGAGTFSTTVSGNGNSRTVQVTSTINNIQKTIVARLTTTNSSKAFNYGLQTGVGGLELYNSAYVSGNVYSGGDIVGHNTAHIDGDIVLTKGNPTLDQSADPATQTNTLAWGDVGGRRFVAQSFTPTLTERVFSLGFRISKVGGGVPPTGTFYIYSDSSDNPGSNLSGNGQALSVTVLSDPAGLNGWTTQGFAPNTNPVLIAGTKYWLVFSLPSTSGTNYRKFVTSGNNGDGQYANGTAKIGSSTSSMSAACTGGCDLAFQVNMGGVYSKLKDMTVNVGPDGGGNVLAHTIDNSTIAKHACYNSLLNTVRANAGASTCAAGAYVNDCNSGFPADAAPYCHVTDPAYLPTPPEFVIQDAEITDYEDQAVNLGGTFTCPSSPHNLSGNIGPRKIICDKVIINSNVTLTGGLWIDGNLEISGNPIIRLDPAYGSNDGYIIVDRRNDRVNFGSIDIQNNPYIQDIAGDAYIMLLATNKNLTETNNAQGYPYAMNLRNSPLGKIILYAPYGVVNIENSAAFKEVTAHKIIMRNSSHIDYETGLASTIFTSGPGAAWTYKKGSYQILD